MIVDFYSFACILFSFELHFHIFSSPTFLSRLLALILKVRTIFLKFKYHLSMLFSTLNGIQYDWGLEIFLIVFL